MKYYEYNVSSRNKLCVHSRNCPSCSAAADRREVGRMDGVVLTWVSANELWPRALLGRRGVRGADQLVLGHLGVGLGKLQPQGLRDLWVEPDPLVAERYFRLLGVNFILMFVKS